METNWTDRNAPVNARAALDGIQADRRQLGQRFKAPAWYYPALAAITAVFVASPLFDPGFGTAGVILAVSVGLIFLESALVKARGVSTNRVPGPRSWLMLIGIGAIALLGLLAVAMLVANELPSWAIVPIVVTAAATLFGGIAYDRVAAAEVRRGR